MQEEYLVHHGILGQKWGIRRYQNEDGSLTDEGRARYGIGDTGDISNKRLYDRDMRKAASNDQGILKKAVKGKELKKQVTSYLLDRYGESTTMSTLFAGKRSGYNLVATLAGPWLSIPIQAVRVHYKMKNVEPLSEQNKKMFDNIIDNKMQIERSKR